MVDDIELVDAALMLVLLCKSSMASFYLLSLVKLKASVMDMEMGLNVNAMYFLSEDLFCVVFLQEEHKVEIGYDMTALT